MIHIYKFYRPHFESKCQFYSKLLIFSNLKIKMGESFLAEPEIENSNQVTPRKNVSIVDSRWTKEPGLPWFGPSGRSLRSVETQFSKGIPVRKLVLNLKVPKLPKNPSRL